MDEKEVERIVEENKALKEERDTLMKAIVTMNGTLNKLINRYVVGDHTTI